ncbi:MAG: hypothetical protein IKP77_07600 [Acholeplasmatales bacterium]|nr:hypothetical protein [Acholeplasmatales bacterium]
MKKLIIKIIVSLILIGIAIGTFVIVNNINSKKVEDSIININIKLYDINESMVSDKDFKVNSDDKLLDILKNNYTIRTSNSTYGAIIYDIDDIKTDFKTTYIAIYVDDKYSQVGISSIVIYDGMKVSFKEMRVYYS